MRVWCCCEVGVLLKIGSPDPQKSERRSQHSEARAANACFTFRGDNWSSMQLPPTLPHETGKRTMSGPRSTP